MKLRMKQIILRNCLVLWGIVSTNFAVAQTEAVSRGNDNTNDIGCVIKPSEVINLNSIISGQVDEVLVKRGDQVEAGQVIVRLDSSLAQSDYNLAKVRANSTADIEIAQKQINAALSKLNIMTNGRNKGVVSQLEFQTAEAEYAQAQALYNKAQEEHNILAAELERAAVLLDKTEIKSPVAAIIGEELIAVGEAVAQEPIVTLLVTEPLRVEAFVPTDQVADLLSQDEFRVRIQNFHDLELPVEFDFISPSAEISSNTTRAYFLLHSSDVPPGVQCKLVSE